MAQPEIQVSLNSVDMPSRKGRLETYLWDYGDEVSQDIAKDFYDPSLPVRPYGVLIPIAAHQDASYVGSSLAEYAKQEGADPFTLFLLLNFPKSVSPELTTNCVAEVRKAQYAHPDLDIRYSVMSYRKPSIGQIRKDLWDAVMRVAWTDGLYDSPGSEMIGINHDIDTAAIFRHYIRNIQRQYRADQQMLASEDLTEEPLTPRYTQVKHGYPFSTHPNIARAIFWADFVSRQDMRGGSYEEGLVIPLSYYAKQGGFKSQDITHETRGMRPDNGVGIAGTGMDTSPRRYIARLGNHGLAGIWTDDSFTATDACRDPKKLPGDITQRQLEDTILQSLDDALFMFGNAVPISQWQSIMSRANFNSKPDELGSESYINSLDFGEEITNQFVPRFRLARRVLELIVGVPEVAQLIDESMLDLHVREMQTAMKEAMRENLVV